MKLGNFLRAAGTARPVNPRAVQFTVKGRDDELRDVVADARAVLVFIDEEARQGARIEARAALARRYPDKTIPDDVLRDEEVFQRLFLALRDADPDPKGRHGPFAESVDELRAALVLPEARRLAEEYDRYLADEFPPIIDDETWKKILEEAEKNSLGALLTSFGYESASRALSYLAGRSSR